MLELTSRQQQVLDFIRRFADENGWPPTRAEIVAAFGFRSPNAAEEHLRALARKGALELLPGASRGIRLAETAANEEAGLPLIGRIAAGAPILAVESVEDRVPVAPGAFSPRADFLLRVRGDSMINAGIHDGDLLAVHAQHEAHNGQIVVARLGDEITVKRYRRDGDWARLLPENPEHAPIRVDLRRQDFGIEGLAVGLVRRFGAVRL